MSERYFCQNCDEAGRDPVVQLDEHLRCEACGSDEVVSLESAAKCPELDREEE